MLPQYFLGPAWLLFFTAQILNTGDCRTVSQKQRHKREWVVPVKKIIENVDYSNVPFVARIRSDMDKSVQSLRYTLRGPGVTQPPVGCFMVEEYKGWVRITRPLDREERENYTLIGAAWFMNNTIAEDNVKINIIVEDQNDNSPVFIKPERGSVYEGSPPGTFVTQVVATDADKPNTLHSKIAYTLIKQEPNNGKFFFAISKDNGTMYVKDTTLDREEQSSYILTVQAIDMYGSDQGNSATATVIIDILDINDNIPTLEKDEFSASIDENVASIEVLQIQALDIDEVWSDNWLAVFEIVTGNEDGHFTIETNRNTNMGVLYLTKPVDFELASNLNLSLVVANKAPPGAPLGTAAGGGGGASIGTGGAAGTSVAGGQPGALGGGGQSGGFLAGGQPGASGGGGQSGGFLAGGQSGASGGGGQSGGFLAGGQSGASGGGGKPDVTNKKTYLVKISVKNKRDGPKFNPKVKPIPVSENSKDNSIPRVITTYTAIDEDTDKKAENVIYAKGYDPDNWISVDTDTAEIILNKVPDRESPFLVNGTYYAKILCITNEMQSQTSTGTIALQVEDLNDNCPKLLDNVQYVCSDAKVMNVTAEDVDADPNGAPLEFLLIPEKTKGKWNLQMINDASASLLAEEDLWPGLYQVTMEIRDKQGLACPDEQVLQLEVCTCLEGAVCGAKMAAVRTTSVTLGVPGIGLMIFSFFLLLLAPMFLIKCTCGSAGRDTFTDLPFENNEHLISYNTEGKGEGGDVLLMSIPLKNGGVNEGRVSTAGVIKAFNLNFESPRGEIHDPISDMATNQSIEMSKRMEESAFGGLYCDELTDTGHEEFPVYYQEEDEILTDALLKQYFTQKAMFISEAASTVDRLRTYNYEGEGSVAGSMGSCSYDESNNDLEFLNNLGSKFLTLAEVCGFRPTQSVNTLSQANHKAIANTVITTPTARENAITEASSSHVTNTVQPSPMEITPISPPVQNALCQRMAMQYSMYHRLDQPMPSNILLSGEPSAGHRQGVYVINGSPGAERLLTQSNSHAHANLQLQLFNGGLPDTIIGDPMIIYSQTAPHKPVMIKEGLSEVNPAVIQSLSPAKNNLMVQEQVEVSEQQLNGIGSLQMVGVPAGSMVSGDNGQSRVTLLDGSVNRSGVIVGGQGQNCFAMSPQSLIPASSHVLSGQVNTNQALDNGSFVSRKGGQGRITTLESPFSGGNLLIGGPGQHPISMRLGTPSGPFSGVQNFESGEGGSSRILVRGPSILQVPGSGSNVLVGGPGEQPSSMRSRNPNLTSMPQDANSHVNNSQLLVNGPLSGVKNIESGEGRGPASTLQVPVSGVNVLIAGLSQCPLTMSPGPHRPVGLPHVPNGLLNQPSFM